MERGGLVHGRVVGGCAAAACLAAAAACSLIVDTNADQCVRDQDCSAFRGARVCVAGLCAPADAAAPLDTGTAVDVLVLDEELDGGPDADAGAGDGADRTESVLDAGTANSWADDAVAHLMLNFWRPSLLGGGYLSDGPLGATPTSYWTFAQAWEAVLDAAARHQGARFQGTLRTLYLAQDARGWGSPSYADENWMILALLRAYELTQDTVYRNQAELLYSGIMNAWDSTCCLTPAGGLWSDRAHTQKSTAINAGAVISGARLYEDENTVEFLQYAQRVYDYWSTAMVDTTSGRVSDQLVPGGQKSASTYTYDQGLMIGAGLALADATDGGAAQVSLASTNAQFLLSRETAPSPFGPVLSDGSCTGDCEQYKGIAARYLGQLVQRGPGGHPEYMAVLEASALGAHELARDPMSGTYAADWSVPYAAQATPVLLNATSSAASVLSTVASILGAPADPSDTYQAEEAVLHGVGVDAKYAGFEGWGYIAGWNEQGQVDFLITVPADGQYDLTFRYAAASGTAARVVAVNGSTTLPPVLFPDTGDWGRYASQSVTVNLAAGDDTITLSSSPLAGTYNVLNLDQLMVALHP